MPIPKHDDLRIPIMKLLSSVDTMRSKDFIEPLATQFKLTESEVQEMYPSGNGQIFADRISWALSYLNMASLVEKPKRGVYRLNQKGIDLIKTPEKVDSFIEKQLVIRNKQKKGTTQEKLTIEEDKSDSTPQEKLSTSYSNIRKSVFADILDTILKKSPIAFEKLVVSLLQKMGYGGEIKDSGLVTKASNDGGIDGIIKEDELGFGRIHIQAKRYKLDLGIGREEIQKFVGALAVAQSNKGVFITTSYFTKGAIEYVENLYGSTTIVLIDGKKLAEYIYDFGLGMQVEQTIMLKTLDSDFWDDLQDDVKQS